MGKKSREKMERRSEVKESAGSIEAQQSRLRISLLRFSVATALLTAVAGIGYFILKRTDSEVMSSSRSSISPPPRIPEVTQDLEARTWALIKKIEAGILDFEKKLPAVVDDMEAAAFADLVSLIGLVKHNQQFEKRNHVIAQRELIEKLGWHHFLYRELNDYFLQFGDNAADRGLWTFALFFPPEFSVCVRENIDMSNPAHLSSIVHEIGHAQDYFEMYEAYARGELPGFAAMKEVWGISIQSEVKRYAYQIELLNGMIGGYLRKTVEGGGLLVNNREQVNVRTFLGLADTPENNQFVVTFLYLAQEYYSGGGLRDSKVSLGFFRRIYERYRLDKTFLFLPDGTAVLLTPENLEQYEDFGRSVVSKKR